MNLNTAIILSKESEDSLRKHKFPAHADAIKLGLEAMKAIRDIRNSAHNPDWLPLPGEDSFIDTTRSDHTIKAVLESPEVRK